MANLSIEEWFAENRTYCIIESVTGKEPLTGHVNTELLERFDYGQCFVKKIGKILADFQFCWQFYRQWCGWPAGGRSQASERFATGAEHEMNRNVRPTENHADS